MNERELLQRVVTAWEDDRFELIDAMEPVVDDIRRCLEKPKKKRERLSDAFIYEVGNRRVIAEFNDEFHAGVRFAERHHGIGGEE